MTKITKTNIRINSDFLIKDDEDKYYITDISILKKYRKTSDDDLSKFIKDNNDVTDKIEKLIKKFDIHANINILSKIDLHNIQDSKNKKTIPISGGKSM